MSVICGEVCEAEAFRPIESFPVPEEYTSMAWEIIAGLDTRFSPEAVSLEPSDKEMHGVQIQKKYCEVVKYRDYDGKIVRSLEVPLRKRHGKDRQVAALSIKEDSMGNLEADTEIFSIHERSDGGREIIPGVKQPFEAKDYEYLSACMRWVTRRPLLVVRFEPTSPVS